jgi:hypothetical protein
MGYANRVSGRPLARLGHLADLGDLGLPAAFIDCERLLFT